MLILVGWAISFGAMDLLVYAPIVGIAFHLRVLLGEEPFMVYLQSRIC